MLSRAKPTKFRLESVDMLFPLRTLTLAILVCSASSADILGVFFIPSISHQFFYRALMKELNLRGHNLTILTTDPINDPSMKNYAEVDLGYYYPKWRKRFDMASDAASILRVVPELFYLEFTDSTNEMCELFLSDPNVQRIIQSGPVFDLVIVEFGIMPCNYAFATLSKNRAFMGIFSFSLGSIVQSNIGNTASTAYLPDPFLPYLDHMTLPQRLRNFVFQCVTWMYYWYVHRDHLQIARKHFGADTPSLIEFERNVSAIMTNTHHTVTFPRPAGPNYIDIGGTAFHLHHWTPTVLPQVCTLLILL